MGSKYSIFIIFFLFLSVGCVLIPSDPLDSPMQFSASPGDIVVVNYYSRELVALDSDGNFKGVLFKVDRTAESIVGVAWMNTTNEILVAVDGADRIVAISAYDGAQRILIANANLVLSNANLGLAQLSGGDILISEAATIERFNSAGLRKTTGWPLASWTNIRQMEPTAAGGYVVCSAANDLVGVYGATGTLIASRASGIAATTDGYGCKELSNGSIVASWSGTSNAVSIYNSALTTELSRFDQTDTLIPVGNPRAVAETLDGNILVLDYTYERILEITQNGSLVKVLGESFLNQPLNMIVIPNY